MEIRPPAVAGLFYPGQPQQLQRTVEQLLADATPQPSPPPSLKALVAPHAGYRYSGAAAACAYALLPTLAPRINRVVMLGPAHRVPMYGLALPECDAFATPLGEVPLDSELIEKAAELPQVHRLPTAHQQEHSLEVHLPFLQTVLGDFTLLPLVVGDASDDEVAEVLDTVWGDDHTLIVISSDLSHFLPYDAANRVDRQTSEKIEHFDTDLQGKEACGCHPLNGLLRLARDKSLHIQRLALCNSGDTAGDKSQVVGYGAWALY